VRQISDHVDNVFARIKYRALGPDFAPHYGDKRIYIGYKPAWSLPGLYRQAAAEEASKANETTLHGMMKIAEGYLDAERERTKARVLHAVQAYVHTDPDAEEDLDEVLGNVLAPIWEEATAAIVKTVDTSATTARNMGTLDGVEQIAAAQGQDDPYVFFVVVRDNDLCEECKRVHHLPDGRTPRVFKLSEVSSGYHKRGDDTPSVSGLHPHCRCSLTSMAKGYGFDAAGFIKFIDLDHDEYAAQRE
jgi:hypothetical protein